MERFVIPTFWLRRPTPTHRTRGSLVSGPDGSAKAPSVKTWISARGSAATSARAVRMAARDVEAGGRDVGRLHRSGGVEHDDDLARAVPHERHGRARQRHGEGEERQELEDQQRVALEPLEERGRLPVAERRIPQEQARHTLLAAADLEEVEEDERQRQREQRERERREETHTRRRPLTCESTKSC